MKRQFDEKQYEDLTFTDDFMFCKVLENDEELSKELLELILNVKIRKVVCVSRQSLRRTYQREAATIRE